MFPSELGYALLSQGFRLLVSIENHPELYFRPDFVGEQLSKFYKLATGLINAVENLGTMRSSCDVANPIVTSVTPLFVIVLLLLSTYGGNKSNNFSRDFTRGAARYDAFIKSILAILLESTCTLPSIIFFFFFFFRSYRRYALLQFDVYSPRRETALTRGTSFAEILDTRIYMTLRYYRKIILKVNLTALIIDNVEISVK